MSNGQMNDSAVISTQPTNPPNNLPTNLPPNALRVIANNESDTESGVIIQSPAPIGIFERTSGQSILEPEYPPPARSNTFSPLFSSNVRVCVRTLFHHFDKQEFINFPRNCTTKQIYAHIQSTKEFAEKYCTVNLIDKELSLEKGSCTISCDCGRGPLIGEPEHSHPLENVDDWGTIEAIVADYEKTGHKNIQIIITRKLELRYKRVTMPSSGNIRVWLWRQLGRQIKHSSENNACVYIPREDLERLITNEVVTSVVQEDTDLSIPIEDAEARKTLAEAIYHKSRVLFASIVYEKLSFRLLELLLDDDNMELNDTPLPLKSPPWFNQVDDEDLELEYRKLYQNQWLFRAAVFNIAGKHQDLDDKVVVPYLSKKRFDGGNFSILYKVRIEASHQTIYELPENKNPELALKVITHRGNMDQAFRNEQLILRGLRDVYHDHIIQILGSYHQNNQYHFLFPLADCNLEIYMAEAPPGFRSPDSQESKVFIAWLWSQLQGIASGLSTIHNNPREASRQEGLIPLNNKVEDVNELKFLDANVQRDKKTPATGYHHDIKPQNILHFAQNKIRRINNSVPKHGILQIADFGIGKFHSQQSGTGTRTFRGTVTYAAPESKIPREQNTSDGIEPTSGLKVSRSYDIWSFGCVIMEVLVWLVFSAQGRLDFMNKRFGLAVEGDSSVMNDAFFYVINSQDPNIKEAKLREGVVEWIQKLKLHPRIHDKPEGSLARGLGLVEQVLEVDPSKRMNAKEIEKHLKRIAAIAEGECSTVQKIQESASNQSGSSTMYTSQSIAPDIQIQPPISIEERVDNPNLASEKGILDTTNSLADSLANSRRPPYTPTPTILSHPQDSPGILMNIRKRTDTDQTATSISSTTVERSDSFPQ